MKILTALILVVLVLLSVMAGVAKVMNMPQEIQFFEDAGLSLALLRPLGVIQILGGLLAIYPTTRRIGSAVMSLGFLFSALAIYMTGNTVFGTISLLPVLFALVFAWRAGDQPAEH